MGRTNIVLDDKLIQDCIKATGIKIRRNLVDHALKELLRHKNQKWHYFNGNTSGDTR